MGTHALKKIACRHGGLVSAPVDVRGTGACYGQWEAPWSPAEVQDFYEIIDWITRQPWSDGRVAASGVSYTGAG